MRLMRHPLRLASRAIVLACVWRNRHDLVRWSRFAARLPSEVKGRELSDILTEVRARLALTAEPRTRWSGDVDITGFGDGSLLVRAPGGQPIAPAVRDMLAAVPGVVDIRVVDDRLPTTPASPAGRPDPGGAPRPALAPTQTGLIVDPPRTT
jgi:hypothetical protein